MGSLESDTTGRLPFHFSLSCIGEGNGNPLQCSCLENPRDGKPGGLLSLGLHRVGHDCTCNRTDIKITCIFISVQLYLFAYFLSSDQIRSDQSLSFFPNTHLYYIHKLVLLQYSIFLMAILKYFFFFLTAIFIVHFPVIWSEDLQCCRLEYILFSPLCSYVVF